MLEYAHRQLEEADNLFSNGDVDKAQADIQEVLVYTRKAAEAARPRASNEADRDRPARAFEAYARHRLDLAVEDRPPVREAVDTLSRSGQNCWRRCSARKAKRRKNR